MFWIRRRVKIKEPLAARSVELFPGVINFGLVWWQQSQRHLQKSLIWEEVIDHVFLLATNEYLNLRNI
jgi:hypothetical protein